MAGEAADIIGGCLLALAGWTQLRTQDRYLFEQHQKVVVVFSHTSFMDFVIYMLYWLSWATARRRTVVLMNSYHMNMWGWICRHFGAIVAPSVFEKGNGSTQAILDQLLKKDDLIFLISPKGIRSIREWRSGYYHIARGLGCPVVCGGLDYNKHIILFTGIVDLKDKTYEQVTYECQSLLKSIVPLHPERSEFELLEECRNMPTSIIPRSNLYLLILICLGLIGMLISIW